MPSTELQLMSNVTPFMAMDPVNAILPVPYLGEGDTDLMAVTEGDKKLSVESEAESAQDTGVEKEDPQAPLGDPEVVGRGWLRVEADTRVDALFMISEGRLGCGRTDVEAEPLWYDLRDIVNLDGIGEPEDGVAAIEFATIGGAKVIAGWTQGFCDAVIEALQSTIDQAHATSDSGAVESVQADGSTVAANESSEGGSAAGVLELEDVTYLGGFPGEPRKRKRCSATLSHEGVQLNGQSEVHMRLAWGSVRSVEAQNSDEARFRTNTKIHRDSSALVFECTDGATVMFEAKACPTIPLRQAISTLLEGVDVTIK